MAARTGKRRDDSDHVQRRELVPVEPGQVEEDNQTSVPSQVRRALVARSSPVGRSGFLVQDGPIVQPDRIVPMGLQVSFEDRTREGVLAPGPVDAFLASRPELYRRILSAGIDYPRAGVEAAVSLSSFELLHLSDGQSARAPLRPVLAPRTTVCENMTRI